MVSAIEDNNPVIYIEHRWLHNVLGNVPKGKYGIPLGKAKIVKEGKDLTIISSSYMTLEAIRAAEVLGKDGIDAEVLDLRTIKPLDQDMIMRSVRKTGRLIVVDGAWKSFGVSAEILALVSSNLFDLLKCAPIRIAFPDFPTPTSPALAKHYYPRAIDIINRVRSVFKLPKITEEKAGIVTNIPLDVPDKTFTGPF